uniref:Transmembrane protein n=2 Tax=Lactuca sativa TaxID=4236 RepID=A0A9R1XWG4_LACSA|nr:hypothetical protein LSAT_V11C100019720 [Lactuca sativa]
MAIIGDALRQAFMPKHEYQNLRNEDKAWIKLRRPIVISIFVFLIFCIVISSALSFKMVFPSDLQHRPFCKHHRIESTTNNDHEDRDFNFTDQQIVYYYWMIAFVPSAILFSTSAVYLVAGMSVAYTAPTRHGFLKVVENNYCAPNGGGVRCLYILNSIFAIMFGFVAIFFGLVLLTSESICSLPLFWCYEVQWWGLVTLYGATASLLRRKAAMILDDGDIDGHNQIIGIEMLEFGDVEMTPDVERRINQGFRSWMGTSYLSSDDEDEDENG